jgi:hypothetical protein
VDIPASFVWIIVLFNGPLEYGDGGIFKLLRQNEKLVPLNVDPYNFVFWQVFRGRTTFNETTFARIQKYKNGGPLKVKIHVLFYEETRETLHLVKLSFV